MELFLDLYGFLSVVLHAAELMARSVLLGSIAFLAFLAAPLAGRLPAGEGAMLLATARRAILWGGWLTLGAVLCSSGLGALALIGTLGLGAWQAAGAGFVLSALGVMACAAAALVLARGVARPWPLLVMGLLLLVAAVAGSHAMARTEDRLPMLAATFIHQAGAALWLGGLPAFLMALRLPWPPSAAQAVGARYSGLAVAGVLGIVAGVVGYYLGYVGSPEAIYGTAYGAMSATKSVLFAVLLLLGLANFLLLHRFAGDGAFLPRLRRFVECELIVGICVFGIAASLTSVPPGADLPDDRVSWAEIAERAVPRMPRFTSPSHADLGIPALQAQLDAQARENAERPQAFIPGEGFLPPRNAFDIAWSEYNHHMSGFVVLAVGLAALADATRRVALARHWPLLFMGLAAFLFARSDPEAWPMGDIGFFDSLRDPEVLQHKLLSLLVVVFAVSEWLVRLRGKRSAAAYVFPIAMALGGFLLLAHTHAIANVKEALLVELSHLPLGAAAVVASCARWLELRAGPGAAEARIARWVWPLCLVFISALLIFYREA
ncbi:copper resistance D family protein [Rhodovarius sp.]|uniref:copper resistance D family protein n=1 Tax=Rhodovarius sp. TaxID=2972673 RepID=UPI0034A0F2C0